MLQTVLGGAQCAADVGDVVDGVLDGGDGRLRAGLGAQRQLVDAQRLGVHVLDGDLQLVEAVGGVADLEGQGLALGGGVHSAGADQAGPVSLSGILSLGLGAGGNIGALVVLASQVVLGVVHAALALGEGDHAGGHSSTDLEVLVVLGGLRQAGNSDLQVHVADLIGQVDDVVHVLILAVGTLGDHIGAVADLDGGAILEVVGGEGHAGHAVQAAGSVGDGLLLHGDGELVGVVLGKLAIGGVERAGGGGESGINSGGSLLHGEDDLVALHSGLGHHAVELGGLGSCLRVPSIRNGLGQISALKGLTRAEFYTALGRIADSQRLAENSERGAGGSRSLNVGDLGVGEVDGVGAGLGGLGQLAVGQHGDGHIGLAGDLHIGAQRAVQQLDAVEVGAVGDAVDFRLELLELVGDGLAVHLVLISAVGGLLSQIDHAVEHVVDLLGGALSGLHQGDAVLHVLLSGGQAGDLSAHLLADGQTGGVVAGAVDPVAGGQLLQVLGNGGGVVGVVAVGVHRHNVVLNTHKL